MVHQVRSQGTFMERNICLSYEDDELPDLEDEELSDEGSDAGESLKNLSKEICKVSLITRYQVGYF